MSLRSLLVGLALAIGLSWAGAGQARAAAICTVTFSPIIFGANINILSGAPISGVGSATIQCAGFGVGQSKQEVICVGLGPGLNSSGAPRKMTSGANQLAYDIYTDPGHTTRWSSALATDPSFVLSAATPQATFALYAQIGASQTLAPVGAYLDSVLPAVYSGAFNGVTPSCNQLSTFVPTSPFQVTAAITANCGVAATNMNFGSRADFSQPLYAISVVSVTCTNNAPYWVALDGGLANAADPRRRKMTNGAHSVTYGLYRDSAMTQPWGATYGVDTQLGVGSSNATAYRVYGQVPAQPTPAPGLYSDTVTASVNF